MERNRELTVLAGGEIDAPRQEEITDLQVDAQKRRREGLNRVAFALSDRQ